MIMSKKNKIALISYHNAPNYGTMLQAYALYYALKKLGYDSEYISYDYSLRGWRRYFSIFKTIVLHPSFLFNKLRRKKEKDEFDFFKDREFDNIINLMNDWYEKYIPHTDVMYNCATIKQINSIYDNFIVGSDQTWSPFMSKTYSSFCFNFLQFVKKNKKKSSYAPSFGTLNLSESYLDKISYALKSFSNISCREKQGAEIISKKLGREVFHVLDPTLLLTPEDWSMVSSPIDMPDKYILCYILGERQCISDFAEQLGNKTSLPVYYILTRPFYLSKKNLLSNVGPGEFISLISRATYVCTDSFHGTIFSINFNVPFFSFNKRDKSSLINDNDRMLNILKDFGLENRFSENTEIVNLDDIDFGDTSEMLLKRRAESISYLNKLI